MFAGTNLADTLAASLTEIVLYSLILYETIGSNDLGSNFWNQGRTEEIKERYVHLTDVEDDK